jgi:hypothetical protein
MLVDSKCSNRQLINQQKELLESLKSRDSLIVLSNGNVSKLHDEVTSSKKLMSDLYKDNKELAHKLEEVQAKVISLTQMVIKPEDKKDTFYQDRPFIVGQKFSRVFTYPEVDKPFILHTIEVDSTKLVSDWKFNDIRLNLTVFEDVNKKWNSILTGPDWIKIGNLEVKSLDPDKIRKVPVFYGAAGITFDPILKSITGHIGFEHKKTIILGGLSTQKSYNLTIVRKFRWWK